MSSVALRRLSAVVAIASLWLCCQPDQPSAARRYALKGRVVSVDGQARRLTIAHEEIPGLMQAMTMPFTVKDDRVLKAVGPGDEVRATLVVTEESSWLEDVVVSRASSAVTQPVLAVPGEPAVGEAVSDFTLVNQDGRPIHLDQYRGKSLVLTFIYTRCPLPEYCPRMTHHFWELEKALKNEPLLYKRTHLLSVSFDTEHDRPEVLRQYSDTKVPGHSDAFEHWELATGSTDEIRAITKFFGLTYVEEEGQFVHSLRTAVIGPEGKLRKLYRGNAWEPEDILRDLEAIESGR